jgi:hypothetical protein
MCLFYENPSGHARSDPILNQGCPSNHVHTFYGPQNFHPNTTNEELRNTKPEYSSSPWVENQSLYWHPSIYEVIKENDETVYKRVSNLDTSPYYRWDRALSTVAFPPGFQMIAYSNQDNAEGGGETGSNLFVECCNFINGDEEEDCTTTEGYPLIFPKQKCDVVGIGFGKFSFWDASEYLHCHSNSHLNNIYYIFLVLHSNANVLE